MYVYIKLYELIDINKSGLVAKIASLLPYCVGLSPPNHFFFIIKIQ
jgi:hypothetical protein